MCFMSRRGSVNQPVVDIFCLVGSKNMRFERQQCNFNLEINLFSLLLHPHFENAT